MSKHPLEPAFSKIRRAETHIKDLKAAIRAFLDTRPYRLTSKLNDDATEEVWSIEVDAIPEGIECIAADAIHNLRTPLDKMLASGFRNPSLHQPRTTIQSIKFPFGEGAKNFGDVLIEKKEHFTAGVIKFLCDCEPYNKGAGHTLWAINQLDNRDKHRALLEPIKLGFSTTQHRLVAGVQGFVLRMGSRKGSHMIPVPEARPGAWHMHQPDETLAPILRMTIGSVGDYFLEYTSPYNDMEVMTTTPGAKVYADIKPTLNIAFSEVPGFEGIPVVNALETMRESVAAVLDEFASRFF